MEDYCKEKEYPRKNEKARASFKLRPQLTDEVKTMQSHHQHPITEHLFALFF